MATFFRGVFVSRAHCGTDQPEDDGLAVGVGHLALQVQGRGMNIDPGPVILLGVCKGLVPFSNGLGQLDFGCEARGALAGRSLQCPWPALPGSSAQARPPCRPPVPANLRV